MIVLIIKSDLIRHQPLPGYTCPHCARTNGMDMDLHQRYAEFGTGKVYPEGIFGVVHCLHCGHTLPASRWTDDLHRAYKMLKGGYKTPRSYWKGAIITAVGLVGGTALLVLVLSIWGHFARIDIEKKQNAYESALRHPTVGTTLAGGDGVTSDFYVWRVSRVGDDTVWLKKYIGPRTLTNFYTETGWHTLPDQDFSVDAVGYSAKRYADNCLMDVKSAGDPAPRCAFTIFALLDK